MRIFTDGACSTNGTWKGGYGTAWVGFTDEGEEIEGRAMDTFDGEDETTNNRMELMASIVGLKKVQGMSTPVELYSDSNYVIQGLNEWAAGWERRGWRKSDNKQIENMDLWKELWALWNSLSNVKAYWNKGHVKPRELAKYHVKFNQKNKLNITLEEYTVINKWNGIVDELATRYQNGVVKVDTMEERMAEAQKENAEKPVEVISTEPLQAMIAEATTLAALINAVSGVMNLAKPERSHIKFVLRDFDKDLDMVQHDVVKLQSKVRALIKNI